MDCTIILVGARLVGYEGNDLAVIVTHILRVDIEFIYVKVML